MTPQDQTATIAERFAALMPDGGPDWAGRGEAIGLCADVVMRAHSAASKLVEVAVPSLDYEAAKCASAAGYLEIVGNGLFKAVLEI